MTFNPDEPFPTAGPKLPTHASEPRLTLGDLDKTLTVRQAMELAQDVRHEVSERFESLLEHWTDDEGIHYEPLGRDLEDQLPLAAEAAAAKYLRQIHIL